MPDNRSTRDAGALGGDASNYPAVQNVRLGDGRQLAWYEFGDPMGKPCIFVPGTPAGGAFGAIYHEAAQQAGVRWISVDKPGYGHSDFQANRRLLDWPQDVAALADQLGLRRFAAVGESGGGPYALAMAYAIPDRLTLTIALAGLGPAHESWVRQGMKPLNRRLFWLARNAPWLLRWPMGSMARSLDNPKNGAQWLIKQTEEQPMADQEVLRRHPEVPERMLYGLRMAFRCGSAGAAQEMAMLTQPWGFSLHDIRSPVQVWHGAQDVNVPLAVALRVAEEIPGCARRIASDRGHLLLDMADELMATVASA